MLHVQFNAFTNAPRRCLAGVPDEAGRAPFPGLRPLKAAVTLVVPARSQGSANARGVESFGVASTGPGRGSWTRESYLSDNAELLTTYPGF